MTQFAEGKKAPLFSLPSSEGGKAVLSSFQGKANVVLFFYPKDMTPGCTQESCDFRDALSKITDTGSVVLGISADSIEKHEKFRNKYSLNFPLLSDEDKKVLNAYSVWQKKSLYGKQFMGIVRTTAIIDKKGVVRKIFSKVKVEGHVDEVLAVLKTL